MIRAWRSIGPAALVLLVGGALLPPEAGAQTVSKNLQRSFNGQPYQASYSFFTAQSGEATIDFSRLTGTCQDVPDPCTSDDQCLSGVCYPLGQICIGQVYVYPLLGQVSVLTKAEFCTAAVCASQSTGYLPTECDPAVYPCTTPCPNPSDCNTCAEARALCLCNDGFLCPTNDAVYNPGGAVFDETFTSAANANAWTLSHASVHPNGDGTLELGENTFADPTALNAVAFASARVPLTPGGEYVLVFKHSFSPFVPGLVCQPYGLLQAHLEGRPPVCDIDQDGSPVDQDCQDGDPTIYPGLPDAICNGIDNNCAGGPDEQFVREPDRWTPASVTNEPAARTGHTMIAAGNRIVVWGGGNSVNQGGNTGGAYDPVSDTWVATPTTGPGPRFGHTAVWTGTRMIIWGGVTSAGTSLNTGGLYNPATNTWTGTTSTSGAPTARYGHIAVWTGTHMLVWGGRNATGTLFGDGAVYDPATNSWRPMAPAPLAGRFGHIGVWTGARLVVWGGQLAAGLSSLGGIYDPKDDTWVTTNTVDAPTARTDHSAVTAGGDVFIWGGRTTTTHRVNDGARLHVGNNSWTPLGMTGVPSARSQHGAIWTGSTMIVWGGGDTGAAYADGARYDPGTDRWTPLTTLDAPAARILPGAVWYPTTGRMMIWGGLTGSFSLADGRHYNPGGACGVGACAAITRTSCDAGVINFACTPGTPTAEVCNNVDDNCDGTIDNGVAPVSGSPLNLQVTGAMAGSLTWGGVPGGQAGDVVWGYIAALRANNGNYAISTNGCLANDDADRQVSDFGNPAPGDAFWYLVREVNLCSGPGTYDEGLPSQVAPRDAGIAASGVACP
ncbi:MAG TPA: kelch repeat-containing protein [Candidatus Polarisedimenticolia bacterium]|nr:kelch repeat-containing protein [Candidatus Polarisedimenticolia bacterium]